MRRLSEGFYPGLICAIVIMVLVGMPGDFFPAVVTLWDWLSPDKLVHLLIFGLLSFMTLWGYRNVIPQKNKNYFRKLLVVSSLVTISYAGLTEILQKYVFVGRYGCVYDFIADTIGCILGVLAFMFYCKKNKKISRSKMNI